MVSKTIVLITGANTGIGYETVKALLQSSRAYQILLCGRDISKAQQAASTLKEEFPQSSSEMTSMQLDVTDDSSIDRAYEEVEASFGKLDSLVNNAGKLTIAAGAGFDGKVSTGEMTLRESWNATWDVNVTGTHILTSKFVPLLLKSSDPRLLFITSGLSTLAGAADTNGSRYTNPPAGWPKPPAPAFLSYRASKTGLNMVMLDWDRVLKNDGVKVWCISPGFLATGLQGVGADALRKMGAGEPSVGGVFIKDVVEGQRDHETGKVVASWGGTQAW